MQEVPDLGPRGVLEPQGSSLPPDNLLERLLVLDTQVSIQALLVLAVQVQGLDEPVPVLRGPPGIVSHRLPI